MSSGVCTGSDWGWHLFRRGEDGTKVEPSNSAQNERNSYGFSSIKAEGNTAYLKVALQNTDVDTAYFISEIGVFARKKGSSEEAVLVLIAVAEIPDYFPEKSNAITIVQNIAIEFEDVKQLSIADDMGAYALVNTEYNVPDTLQSLVSGENMGTALGKLAKAVEALSQVKTKLETKPSYEEGVFSPSIMNGNIVPSLIQAEYKKVDRIVYIAIKFFFNTAIDTTQIGGILGLPFVVSEENATGGFYPLFARTTNGNYVGFVSYDNYMEQVPAISVSDLLRQQSTKVIKLYGQYEIAE